MDFNRLRLSYGISTFDNPVLRLIQQFNLVQYDSEL